MVHMVHNFYIRKESTGQSSSTLSRLTAKDAAEKFGQEAIEAIRAGKEELAALKATLATDWALVALQSLGHD